MMKLIMCLTLVSILIIESESKSDNLLENFNACMNYVIANGKKKDEDSTSEHLRFKNQLEEEKDLKIVNGTLADIINFPYMSYVAFCRAEILIQNYCGGSIITEYHILTAAHCCTIEINFKPFYEKQKSNYFMIEVGSSEVYKGRGGIFLEVTEVHVHPDYYLVGTFGRDLGVLKVAEKFPMSNRVATIPVATPELSHQLQGIENSHTECVAAGWGRTKSNEANPNHLRSVKLPLMPIDQCIILGLRTSYSINRNEHLCTYRIYKDTCQGDSGGGLVCPSEDGVRRVWGVISFGKYCGQKLKPGYYARVDNADSFLNRFLGTKSNPVQSAATLQKAVLKLSFSLVLQVSCSSIR